MSSREKHSSLLYRSTTDEEERVYYADGCSHCNKTFFIRRRKRQKNEMSDPGKHFKPIILFASKAVATLVTPP